MHTTLIIVDTDDSSHRYWHQDIRLLGSGTFPA